MIKKVFAAVFFLLFLILPSRALAADFTTSYNVLFDVSEDGTTTVIEKISLTNLTSESYASKFKLSIGATEISDIKASDPGGALVVSSKTEDQTTTIEMQFNQQVAGAGKVLPFTFSFKSKDFAEKVGKVWEIRTPKVAFSDNLDSYNLIVAVPLSFGEPSQVSPTPKSESRSSGKLFMSFDKEQLLASGISANFGLQQLFDFELDYHLQNENIVPILTNIALPPDTGYQDVIFQRIYPIPENVTLDSDGNYLAWYKLARNQKMDIKVNGSAKIYAYSKVKNPTLEPSLKIKYTNQQKFWDKDNPIIQSKINKLLEGNSQAATFDKARIIYQFVVNNLKYDKKRLEDINIERLGAVTALNNPDSAVCMEFTDLFIALARAAGIPARELNGYAHTVNPDLRPSPLDKDLLHAWPEFWDDKRGWVMVDPTWGNTTGGVDYFNKFDLNHFVFVMRGLNSEIPVPAGSYKFDNVNSHDVKVSISDKDFLGKPQLKVEIDSPNPIISGFPNVLKVKITNNGNAVYPSEILSLKAGHIDLLPISVGQTGVIPAYGSALFEFKIKTKSLLDTFNDQIVVVVGDQKLTQDVSVRPFIILRTIPLVLGGVIVLMISIYLSVLGVHFYRALKIKAKAKK